MGEEGTGIVLVSHRNAACSPCTRGNPSYVPAQTHPLSPTSPARAHLPTSPGSRAATRKASCGPTATITRACARGPGSTRSTTAHSPRTSATCPAGANSRLLSPPNSPCLLPSRSLWVLQPVARLLHPPLLERTPDPQSSGGVALPHECAPACVPDDFARVLPGCCTARSSLFVEILPWSNSFASVSQQQHTSTYPHDFLRALPRRPTIPPLWHTALDACTLARQMPYGCPFKPFAQLMGVLPAASGHCLPACYRPLMSNDPRVSPIADFYPTEFALDLNGKRYDWQAVALLPFIDEARLLAAIAPLHALLSPEELRRNSFGQTTIYARADAHPVAQAMLKLYGRTEGGPQPRARVEQRHACPLPISHLKYRPDISHGSSISH